MLLSPRLLATAGFGAFALVLASVLGVVNGVDDLREGEHLVGGLTLAAAAAPGLVMSIALARLVGRRGSLMDDVLARGMEMLRPADDGAAVPAAPPARPPLGERESAVLAALGVEPRTVEDLAAATGLRPLALRLSLENLERRGQAAGDETAGWRRTGE